MIDTYSGTVYLNQIDHMGHMNVLYDGRMYAILEKFLLRKRLLAFEHIIDATTKFLSDQGKGFGFAVSAG